MSNDMFNLDNIFDSDGDGNRDLAGVFGVLLRIVLAITTAGFFYVYTPNLFGWLVGYEYAGYMSALVGVFVIDVAAFMWDRIRRVSATTQTQIDTAKWITIGDIVLSATVTIVFFILSTNFIELYDTNGQLNMIGTVVNLLGLAIGTLAIAGNAVAWAYYEANGSDAREQVNTTQLRAVQSKATFEINKQHAQLQVAKTLEGISQRLPVSTRAAAQQNEDRFFNTRFGGIQSEELPPTAVSAAGSGSPVTIVDTFQVQVKTGGSWRIINKNETELNAMELAQNYAKQGRDSRVMLNSEVYISYEGYKEGDSVINATPGKNYPLD